MRYHYYIFALILYFFIPTSAQNALPTTPNEPVDLKAMLHNLDERLKIDDKTRQENAQTIQKLVMEVEQLNTKIKAMEEISKKNDHEITMLTTSIVTVVNSLTALEGANASNIDPNSLLSGPSIIHSALDPIVALVNAKFQNIETQLSINNANIMAIHGQHSSPHQ